MGFSNINQALTIDSNYPVSVQGSGGGSVPITGAITADPSGPVTVQGAGGASVPTAPTINTPVTNAASTSLLTTPTLTTQFSANKTFTNASPSQTISVALNSSDRVAAILLQWVSFTGTGGVLTYGSMYMSVVGGTTAVAYTNVLDAPNPQIPISSVYNQAMPVIVPVYGTADSTVNITLISAFAGYATYSAVFKVIVLTAPDPGLMGSAVAPMWVQGAPALPVSVSEIGGVLKNALTSGSAQAITAGQVWTVFSVIWTMSAAGNASLIDGLSGLTVFSKTYAAAGNYTEFLFGMPFATSIKPAVSAGTLTNIVISYNNIKSPTIV